jgi:hypothetical protein
MATKEKTVDNKKRNMILLGVGGALLAVLLVIQVPKLLGGSSGTPAAAETTTPAASAAGTGVVSAAAASTTATAAAPVAGGASLAGVSIPPLRLSPVDEGQLGSFNLLKPKDPFVQLVSPNGIRSSASEEAASVAAAIEAEQARKRAEAARRKAAQTNVAKADASRKYATIQVNEKTVQTKVDGRFPASKVFLLKKLAPTTATVTIVGGTLPKGQTVNLTLGKTVTLVNGKTGQRTSLRLLYTGATPESITTIKPTK